MPFRQPDSLRYYAFDSLDAAGVTNAVFTRRGGVSPAPWASLNVGGLRGDDPERVFYNRVLSFRALGRQPESVYDVWQVHSAEVICTAGPRAGQPHRKADAILTDRPEVTLFMRFGDCVPILLHDPVRQVVGIAHAGWLGTVRKILPSTVQAMQERYACRPEDIIAAIGPAIAAHHYPVGSQVVEQVRNAFGGDAQALLGESTTSQGNRCTLDLWAANRLLLEQAGVRRIETAGICTACNTEDWYSHRGEQGLTGRFGVLIALREH
jgi:YfiH family protein